MTNRDEQVLGWFAIVRVADVQGIRWVLGALNGSDRPVSTRRAQMWCARMRVAGLVDRAQTGGHGGALVWGTYAGTGVGKPDIYRQTTRHEVAVAATSAHYAAAEYAWQRDERPAYVGGHQADGVALSLDWVELIEVELTGKRMPRYASIFTAFERRLAAREMDAITYLCNPSAARAVRAALMELPAGRAIAPQVQIQEVFDDAGQWGGSSLPEWMMTASTRAAQPRRGTRAGRVVPQRLF